MRTTGATGAIRAGVLVLALATLVAGCSGRRYRFANVEPEPGRYEVVGQGEASATGIMLLNVIPIRQTNKVERAVESLRRRFDGHRVVNVSVRESWFWAFLLNGYRTTVSGTVLRDRAAD